jgi:hypothetical protein
MLARTLSATLVATALVLVPVAAHATGPDPASRAVVAGQETARTVAAPADPASTALPTDTLVTVGLVVLVGASLVLVLAGRRTDDDEPTG